jgi:hypothetical protein
MVVDVTVAEPLIKNDNVRHLPHILSWLLSRLEKISAKIFSELPTNWLIRRFYAKHSFINLLNYDFRHDKNINYPLSTINFQNVTAFLRCRCQRSRFYVPGSGTVSLYMQNILNGIDSAGGIEREELVI